MDSNQDTIDILEEVHKKHPYLDEAKIPIVVGKGEVLGDTRVLEDTIIKKRYLIRTMNDNLKEIDDELARWENKKGMLSEFSKELREYEFKLQGEIIKIRQKRKEVAMDSIIKQKMSDELRKNFPGLIEQYGKLMQEPSEITKSKFASEVAVEKAEVIDQIRKKLKTEEKEKEPKPKEEPKEEVEEK